MLGLIRSMAVGGQLSVLIITHKFREVLAFADEVTILRRGRQVGAGKVNDLGVSKMASLMVGDAAGRDHAGRLEREAGELMLELNKVFALDDAGNPALRALSVQVHRGEIVGVAGVSGNGQTALVEVLAGQRRHEGLVAVAGQAFGASRAEIWRHKFSLLPEEPLRNACVGRMSVAENMAFRNFDRRPLSGGILVSRAALRRQANELIARYNVRTTGPDAPIATLSGGNVQRAVLARELSGEVDVLVCANPVFGLDFAAVADIHGQIVAARNRGAAVLLVSEDLDELLELADRVVVISAGTIVFETSRSNADRQTIGMHMAATRESCCLQDSLATEAEAATPRARAAERIYADLLADITNFRMLPGDRFTETDLSVRFAASRTPIRDALFMLKRDGFVDVRFRSGWHVCPFDFERFDELYELRIVLETAAIERLCQSDNNARNAVVQRLEPIWNVQEARANSSPGN